MINAGYKSAYQRAYQQGYSDAMDDFRKESKSGKWTGVEVDERSDKKEVFTADERADIMNAINKVLDSMGYVAVGYDDTSGAWMDVFIQRQ